MRAAKFQHFIKSGIAGCRGMGISVVLCVYRGHEPCSTLPSPCLCERSGSLRRVQVALNPSDLARELKSGPWHVWTQCLAGVGFGFGKVLTWGHACQQEARRSKPTPSGKSPIPFPRLLQVVINKRRFIYEDHLLRTISRGLLMTCRVSPISSGQRNSCNKSRIPSCLVWPNAGEIGVQNHVVPNLETGRHEPDRPGRASWPAPLQPS